MITQYRLDVQMGHVYLAVFGLQHYGFRIPLDHISVLDHHHNFVI